MHDPDHNDPETYGPYRVEAKIGAGGMGAVFRGVHLKTGQRVAIKVLSAKIADQPRFRRRFAAEIETLKKLKHQNIVRLIGHGEKDGTLFYSMELVEGPSLLEQLQKVKRLDWDTTIQYGIEICQALKHAHDLGVIHRDLKPANLLIEPEGRIKLTDFGIAKLFGASEQTAEGSVLGTADYMAPEQATSGQISPKTDLYSLGSLMYACLVGKPPFGGRNLTQVIHGLKHETPAPLDLILPEAPPELTELIHELLEKDPANRPPTALVVGKRLAAMQVGLRRRSELTQINMDGLTLPEADLGSPITHRKLVDEPGNKVPADPATVHERAPLTDQGNIPTNIEVAQTLAALPTENSVAGPRPVRRDTPPSTPDFSLQPLSGKEPPKTAANHFEVVDYDSNKKRSREEENESDRFGTKWFSILLLGGLLALLVFVIYWLASPQSPVELLESIQMAEEMGDESQLTELREDFVRLYPDHELAPELREALAGEGIDERLNRFVRLIERERGGPISHTAWLEAVQTRLRDPREAAEKLTTWLGVYGRMRGVGNAGTLKTRGVVRLDQLIALSQQLIPQWRTVQEPVEDPRAAQLRMLREWGRKTLSGAEYNEFLADLEKLYGDHQWAKTVLDDSSL